MPVPLTVMATASSDAAEAPLSPLTVLVCALLELSLLSELSLLFELSLLSAEAVLSLLAAALPLELP